MTCEKLVNGSLTQYVPLYSRVPRNPRQKRVNTGKRLGKHWCCRCEGFLLALEAISFHQQWGKKARGSLVDDLVVRNEAGLREPSQNYSSRDKLCE